MSSFPNHSSTETVYKENIILGAGPAGVQMGYHCQSAGQDYMVLESGPKAGSFFANYPRHRKLISINKVHTGSDDPEFNLRMDWNSMLSSENDRRFTDFSSSFFPSADLYVDYVNEYVQTHGLAVQFDTTIVRISQLNSESQENFELEDHKGTRYRCKVLVVATGVSRPFAPDIVGIENAENYADVSVEPQDFTGKKVLIIGKGNSAFETADNLIDTAAVIHVAGPSALKLAWKTHFVGHLRAVNNNILDAYQLKSQHAIIDAHVDRIEKVDGSLSVVFRFVRADNFQKTIEYDRVIACTGFEWDSSMFDDACKPTLTINDRFPMQTSEWESVNIPHLYFAGTITQPRDYKKSTSAFIHGFRYNVRSLHQLLRCKYDGEIWPSAHLSAVPESLMEAVIERVNRTSALWQQFGFLSDLLVIAKDSNSAQYYKEVPVDYISDSVGSDRFGNDANYFVITLEYGPDHDKVDPFDVDVDRANQEDRDQVLDSQYLHPVIRQYCKRSLVSEHHILENLENEWFHAAHTAPLRDYFARVLSLAMRVDTPAHPSELGL